MREFVGEGMIIKITGPSRETSQSVGLSHTFEGLTVPGGEIRLETKLVSGHEQAQVRLWFRDQGSGRDGYLAVVEPARGTAQVVHFVSGQYRVLIERTDLAGLLSADDWNELAVRLQGPEIWLLLGGAPLLHATEPTLETGRVILELDRLGSPDDRQETAAVFRNLEVSGLVGSPERLSTYVPPEPQLPRVGRIYFSTRASGNKAIRPGWSIPDTAVQVRRAVYHRQLWRQPRPAFMELGGDQAPPDLVGSRGR